MKDRYAVFGNPVAHSRSPDIHSRFARQTRQDIAYDRQLVAADGFATAADGFFASGGKGLNITLPFKIDAFRYARELTTRARRAGAVNTLAMLESGVILGDNTDGAGLMRDITVNLQWRIEAASVLILGAGGAVRGVLEPLLARSPGSVIIANRTSSKARDLAGAFSDLGSLSGCGFGELDGRRFDLVINGTSASLAGDLPPLPDGIVDSGSCCYDMMYGADPTVFLQWAARQGVMQLSDGLGMLVEQAAESFLLWRGVRPETAGVISEIRQNL